MTNKYMEKILTTTNHQGNMNQNQMRPSMVAHT
jgi:hypothetical protein